MVLRRAPQSIQEFWIGPLILSFHPPYKLSYSHTQEKKEEGNMAELLGHREGSFIYFPVFIVIGDKIGSMERRALRMEVLGFFFLRLVLL